MCKLGFDLGLKELNADEQTFCQNAVANWTRLKKVILDGDQYRLVSPYDGNHMSVMYAAPDKNKAVLYTYDIHHVSVRSCSRLNFRDWMRRKCIR